MNQDQVRGVVDRVAGAALIWLIAKGYISESAAMQFSPIVVMAVMGAWGFWNNRNKALVQSAAAVPGTTVVTQHDLAESMPEKNIVSAVDNKVIAVAASAFSSALNKN